MTANESDECGLVPDPGKINQNLTVFFHAFVYGGSYFIQFTLISA